MVGRGCDTVMHDTTTIGDDLQCEATCDSSKERNYGEPCRHGDQRAPPAS